MHMDQHATSFLQEEVSVIHPWGGRPSEVYVPVDGDVQMGRIQKWGAGGGGEIRIESFMQYDQLSDGHSRRLEQEIQTWGTGQPGWLIPPEASGPTAVTQGHERSSMLQLARRGGFEATAAERAAEKAAAGLLKQSVTPVGLSLLQTDALEFEQDASRQWDPPDSFTMPNVLPQNTVFGGRVIHIGDLSRFEYAPHFGLALVGVSMLVAAVAVRSWRLHRVAAEDGKLDGHAESESHGGVFRCRRKNTRAKLLQCSDRGS